MEGWDRGPKWKPPVADWNARSTNILHIHPHPLQLKERSHKPLHQVPADQTSDPTKAPWTSPCPCPQRRPLFPYRSNRPAWQRVPSWYPQWSYPHVWRCNHRPPSAIWQLICLYCGCSLRRSHRSISSLRRSWLPFSRQIFWRDAQCLGLGVSAIVCSGGY